MSAWLRRLLRGKPLAVPPPAGNAPPAPPEPLPAEVSGFDVQRELVRSPEPVVFDVGAHVGSMAGEYLRRMPRAFVHCFEPNPAAFEELRRNLAGSPRVAFHPVALAGTVGKASLHVNAFGPTSSLLASDERGASYWGEGLLDTRRTMEVETTTLDAFCAAHGIERIDVLKLDVQGAELSVLEGARRMLGEQRIALVYFEMILAPTYRGQAGLDAYMNLLTAHDYRLFGLYAPMYKRRRLIQADLLFVGSRCLAEYEADAT